MSQHGLTVQGLIVKRAIEQKRQQNGRDANLIIDGHAWLVKYECLFVVSEHTTDKGIGMFVAFFDHCHKYSRQTRNSVSIQLRYSHKIAY